MTAGSPPTRPGGAAAPPPGTAAPASDAPAAAADAAGAWEDLLSAALVGTGRRPPPPAPLAGLPGVDDAAARAAAARDSAEARLLVAAAVLTGYRRAGRRPVAVPAALPPPAEPDGRPPCPDAAAGLLELLLSGEVALPGGHAGLVGEWLAAAARRGCRPPHRLLPALLDFGGRAPAQRPTAAEVTGARGRWLARYHPDWGWVADAALPATAEAAAARFAAAGRGERAGLLARLRAADPAGARRLLEEAWRREPAAERAILLAALATGLSLDDEPFLEAALDDRGGAVRREAAALLGRLPGSRRAARMADRLRPLVAPTGPAGRRTVTVAWPDEPDAAARRDGVTDAAPKGAGVRAWRLRQLVAGAPLAFWPEHLGADPPGVVRLASGSSADLLAGLEEAVAAQGADPATDPAWAAALFAARPSPRALAAMAPGVAADALRWFLAATPEAQGAVPGLLAACPGPWPAALSEVAIDRYRHLGGRASIEAGAALPTLAERLDPSTLPLVESWADGLAGHDALRRRVRSLVHALSLRLAIHQELR